MGSGGTLTDFSSSFSFPYSADHERDWPPYKVFLLGWQPVRAEYEKKQFTEDFLGICGWMDRQVDLFEAQHIHSYIHTCLLFVGYHILRILQYSSEFFWFSGLNAWTVYFLLRMNEKYLGTVALTGMYTWGPYPLS